MHVVVAIRQKSVAQWGENSWFILAEIVRENEIQRRSGLRLIFVMPEWVVPPCGCSRLARR